jgi:hypothetical protein
MMVAQPAVASLDIANNTGSRGRLVPVKAAPGGDPA